MLQGWPRKLARVVRMGKARGSHPRMARMAKANPTPIPNTIVGDPMTNQNPVQPTPKHRNWPQLKRPRCHAFTFPKVNATARNALSNMTPAEKAPRYLKLPPSRSLDPLNRVWWLCSLHRFRLQPPLQSRLTQVLTSLILLVTQGRENGLEAVELWCVKVSSLMFWMNGLVLPVSPSVSLLVVARNLHLLPLAYGPVNFSKSTTYTFWTNVPWSCLLVIWLPILVSVSIGNHPTSHGSKAQKGNVCLPIDWIIMYRFFVCNVTSNMDCRWFPQRGG